MFCTDVLRAWAECSLKDFSQAWRGGGGFRSSGREMAWIHHTEPGRLLGYNVLSWWLYGKMYTGYTESCEASAHLSIHVRSYLLHPASPFNQPSVQPPMNASTPNPSLCCRWVCFVDPSVTAVSEGRLVEWCRGEEGVFGRASPGGRQWRINKTRSKAAGVDRSYQLSGVSWVSMSTLQMGHFLLVASHWSTHAWWKRCMQGNLLETRATRSVF